MANGAEVLKRLADNRVLSITKMPNGTFRISEECDYYFYDDLTREELKALGERLIEMAGQP